MMEEYDIVVIGAGIAGTGLAARLSEICPDKKVLLIDKDKIGAGAAYGYRNVFKEIIDKYKLPYHHKFDGLKIGTHEELFLTVKQDCYLIDYEEVCRIFFNRSNAILRNEEALNIQDKILKTNQNEYKFKYLIDCTGASFFLRKILNKPIPFRYWLGCIKILENKVDNTDYFYFLVDETGFMEDVYPLKDKTLQGNWQYTNKVDFNLISPPENTLYKKLISQPRIIKMNHVVIPISPVMPLAYKNYAFLGDSFGNATSTSGEGIRPILDSAEMLADAIKNDNLKQYEKEWKKRYLNIYIKHLASKSNQKDKIKTLGPLSKYPELFTKILKNEPFELPKEIKKQIPKSVIARQIYNYLRLKAKYALMNFA